MFEMLTGELPYKAKTVDAMVECHLAGTPAELGEYVPDGSPTVARLVRSMLAKKPEDRPSMLEIASALTILDPGDFHAAPPAGDTPGPGAAPRLWHRIFAGSLLAKLSAVVVLATLTVPLFWLRHRAARKPLGEVMAAIPGGTFQMGSTSDEIAAAFAWCNRLVSDGCQKEQFYREYPTRQVTVSSFELDQVEVDNQRFADWLNGQPQITFQLEQKKAFKGAILVVDLYTMYGHGGLTYRQGHFVPLRGFEHRPVTQVTWDAAAAYCRDHGKRLPTEAEWEYAAQGTQGFRFPWGDEEPRCDGVVFARHPAWACGNANPGSENVGTAPQDRSPQGVHDLAGNASEWVQDMFAGGYPPCPTGCRDPLSELRPSDDPVGLRVVRGGDWHTAAVTCRAASRSRVAHNAALPNVGFRCARTPTKN
jgi:formylglycine-generating enzyme required for sulfatase activity